MDFLNNRLYMKDIEMVASNEMIDYSKIDNSSILITGAGGLIGSFIVDVLMFRNSNYNANIKVYILGRNEKKILDRFSYYTLEPYYKSVKNNIFYIIQDVCDDFKFNIDVDYIIHAASNTHPKLYATDPIGTINSNVIGLKNVLDYAYYHKSKRVFMMSSVEIYGQNRGDVTEFDESYLGYIDCNTLRAGYVESKRLCESLCQAYILQKNLDVVIGRLSRIYGPTVLKDDSKALSQFINNTINNENIVLKSEGNQYFSYLYVADCALAILKILIDGKCGEAYNVSDDNSNIKLKDLAGFLAKLSNKKVIFELPNDIEKKGFSTANISVMNSDKLKKIGWKAKYDIKEGVMQTINILKGEKNVFK